MKRNTKAKKGKKHSSRIKTVRPPKKQGAPPSPLLVRNCMTNKVEIANPDTTVTEAAKKMKAGDFGVLPICEKDRIIGMLTDRDIVVRSIAEGKNSEQTKVSDVMTNEVLYCFDDQPISQVIQEMGGNQIKRLPVVNHEKRLVGILSLGDIAQLQECAGQAQEALSLISEHDHREPNLRLCDGNG